MMLFSESNVTRFEWSKLILWGIGLYSVLALAWRFLVLYDFTDGILPRLTLLLVLIAGATLAGRSLRLSKAVDIMPYSLGWMLIAIALDYALLVPTEGLAVYADWNVWVGYVLLAAIPLLAPYTKRAPELPRIT